VASVIGAWLRVERDVSIKAPSLGYDLDLADIEVWSRDEGPAAVRRDITPGHLVFRANAALDGDLGEVWRATVP